MMRLSLGIALVAPLLVGAQERRLLVGSDPKQVMTAFFDALAAERWTDAARLLDPARLERQRRQILRSMRRPPSHPEPTVEEIMRREPKMPRAVAEYQVEQYKQHAARPQSAYIQDLYGVKDTTELKELPVAELGGRWLEAQDFRTHVRRSRMSTPDCEQLPDSVWRMLAPKWVVLGAIEQGDTAYVLHKQTTRGSLSGGPTVTTLLRRSGEWLIEPDDMLERGFGAMSVYVDCKGVSGQAPGRRAPPPG